MVSFGTCTFSKKSILSAVLCFWIAYLKACDKGGGSSTGICGNCDPDFGSRVGCRFRIGPQTEIASRNERSDWDALSGSAFKRKLRPGFWLQSGMPFPVEVSGGSCIPDSSFRVGRAFRMGFKRKLCPRIDMASSGKRVLEYRAGVFGGCGGQGEHRLHTRRWRGGDSHGGTWGVVVLRACRASFTENPFGKPDARG